MNITDVSTLFVEFLGLIAVAWGLGYAPARLWRAFVGQIGEL